MNGKAVTDVQRHIRRMRILRVVALIAVVLNAFTLALNIATGSLLALFPATLIPVLLVLIVKQTRVIGTMRRRRREREFSRPRMTAGDYRRLREMEAELGWEPSEFPEGMTPQAKGGGGGGEYATVARRAALSPVETAPEVLTATAAPGEFTASTALSGSGTLSAPMTGPGGYWRPLSELSDPDALAAEHFAALARVGLKHCLSYCPICAGRLDALMRASILAPKPDLGDVRGDLRRDLSDLSDLDSMRARRWPSVTSDLAPVGAYDFHIDGAGHEWCRDGDGLCWLKFAPDGPWHRQNKTGRE